MTPSPPSALAPPTHHAAQFRWVLPPARRRVAKLHTAALLGHKIGDKCEKHRLGIRHTEVTGCLSAAGVQNEVTDLLGFLSLPGMDGRARRGQKGHTQ